MPKFASFGLVAFFAATLSIGASVCVTAAEPGKKEPLTKQEASSKQQPAPVTAAGAPIKSTKPVTKLTPAEIHSSIKPAVKTATKAASTSPGKVEKPDAKKVPAETLSSTKSAVKTSVQTAAATTQTKSVKADAKQTPTEVINNGKSGDKTAETAGPSGKNKTRIAVQAGHASVPNAKRVHTRSESRSDGLVPPPPPETPTILAMPGMIESVPYELSPASLSAKRKDLVVRLTSAKKVLDDKNKRLADAKSKAIQFQSLFTEGVISKRELDNSQTEAESALNDVNDANAKVTSLQNMITQIDDRLAPKSAKKKKVAPTKTTSVKGKSPKAVAPGANDQKQATKTDAIKIDAVKTDAKKETSPAPNSAVKSSASSSLSGSTPTGGSSTATTTTKASPPKAKNGSDVVDSIPYTEAGDTSSSADKTSKPTATNAH